MNKKSIIRDELKIKIEDVDDVLKIWLKNDNNEFKFLENLEAVYENSIHGKSKEVHENISEELSEGVNYITIALFNKAYNSEISFKKILLKGGKSSCAISIFKNNNKIWSDFYFKSDHDAIKDHFKKKIILSSYFCKRSKDEEDIIIGLKKQYILKIIVKRGKIYFSKSIPINIKEEINEKLKKEEINEKLKK